MTFSGNRREGTPIIINPDKSSTKPKRVSFTEKTFMEGWIQDLVESNPSILPIAEIEPAFAPAMAVGREVGTKSGFIDNLLLSPQGYLTIVETKLWRNPEARREVVGQIIDYAKDLSKWTFKDLDTVVSDYNKSYQISGGVVDSLKRMGDISEEECAGIIDTISRNLRNGRFLLLVVGDGIRESVEEMAEFLQRTPQLQFTLGLVELQVYEVPGEGLKPMLVIPQLVTRTREIVRAIVRVEGKAIDSVTVGIEEEKPASAPPSGKFTLTEMDYFNILGKNVDAGDVEFAKRIIEDMQNRGLIIDFLQGSYAVRLKDPAGSGLRIPLVFVSKEGNIYVPTWLKDTIKALKLPEPITEDYFSRMSDIFGGDRDRIFGNSKVKAVSLKMLHQNYEQFLNLIDETINRIEEAAKKGT